MKTWFVFIILSILLFGCAIGKPPDIASVNAYLSELEQHQGFSGAVLIARDGDVLLSKGFGMADRARQIPNTPQTRYRIHWLTMSFTATAVMQLEADGKLDVRDSICQYIPECPDDWQEISLHHLLTHTSGVSDTVQPWGGETEKPTTGWERVEFIKSNTPYFPPGEQLRYCENGYVILGAIIERVSGQAYAEYLEERVFKPLGMNNSGYEGQNIAVGYKPSGDEAPVADVLFRYAASGLYSTVEDLYLWDQALYGEELLASGYLDRMFTGYAETPSADFRGADYGYGWFIGETLARPVIFHGGVMSGYSSMMLRFPEERVTIIILRNYELLMYDRLEIELAKVVFGEN